MIRKYKCLIITFLIFASAQAEYLKFDPSTNVATPEAIQRLNNVNITPKQIIPALDPYHLLNVAIELQTNGCFQIDCDFYKKRNQSEFSKQLRLD